MAKFAMRRKTGHRRLLIDGNDKCQRYISGNRVRLAVGPNPHDPKSRAEAVFIPSEGDLDSRAAWVDLFLRHVEERVEYAQQTGHRCWIDLPNVEHFARLHARRHVVPPARRRNPA